MRTLVTCVLLAVMAAPSVHAADRYKVGDTVQCDATQIGSFRTGKVVGIQPRPGWPDPFYQVVLEGERDPSLCLPKFMKAAPARGAATPSARTNKQPPDTRPMQPTKPAEQEASSSSNPLCVKGKKLEAALGISWYAATVLAPPDANGMCLVHYDGYPSLYDIPVSAGSLRPAGSGPIVKPSRPVDEAGTAAPASGLKMGEYACYGSGGTVLAGMGFKVVGAGRYTDLDGKNSGTFTVAGGTVTFRGGHLNGETGRNLNAKGQFVTHLYATCEPW